MAHILLSTINARYVHAALGIRYLAANMGELRTQTRILEFVSGMRAADMAEKLLSHDPHVIGLSVYIWNVEETTRLVAHLKAVAPQVTIVVGGPEVSHETESQRVCALADYVVTGWGDLAFAELCRTLLTDKRPASKIIAGGQPSLGSIRLPYAEYTDEDVGKRFLYVEASRGCPFKCEFCLSSLDRTAWPFDVERFIRELEALHSRGARHFRFVDRTFNLNSAVGARILEFFLERVDERLFVHFEVIPDHLPDRLKLQIARFPPGSLQFEVGIQTWNEAVQARISRRQNNARAQANLEWLRRESKAFVHVDLIAGLPGEDLESFARGFDRLYALDPHEIQVGVLKRLRGTPIIRHHRMCYNPDPPYNVLQTDCIGFADLQRIGRFARFWDLIGNSGRFKRTLPMLVSDAPFSHFMRFADWLYASTGRTHEIALERLFEHVHLFLTAELGVAEASASRVLLADYSASGARGALSFAHIPKPQSIQGASRRPAIRQVRHLQN